MSYWKRISYVVSLCKTEIINASVLSNIVHLKKPLHKIEWCSFNTFCFLCVSRAFSTNKYIFYFNNRRCLIEFVRPTIHFIKKKIIFHTQQFFHFQFLMNYEWLKCGDIKLNWICLYHKKKNKYIKNIIWPRRIK